MMQEIMARLKDKPPQIPGENKSQAEIRVSKRGVLACRTHELKLKGSPSVFFHDGLETGLNVRCGT